VFLSLDCSLISFWEVMLIRGAAHRIWGHERRVYAGREVILLHHGGIALHDGRYHLAVQSNQHIWICRRFKNDGHGFLVSRTEMMLFAFFVAFAIKGAGRLFPLHTWAAARTSRRDGRSG